MSSQIWNLQIWLCRIWDLNIWGGCDCGYGCDPFPTTGDDVDHPDFSSPGISHAHIFGAETTRILRPNSTSNNPTVDLSNFRDIDWTVIWDFEQCKWWLVKLKPFLIGGHWSYKRTAYRASTGWNCTGTSRSMAFCNKPLEPIIMQKVPKHRIVNPPFWTEDAHKGKVDQISAFRSRLVMRWGGAGYQGGAD